MNKQFARDVKEGLSSESKFLLSKYFYDTCGDEIFQQIMSMEEYYLTDCEYEIFRQQKRNILPMFSPEGDKFDLVEFGAGDGIKTKILIDYFYSNGVSFRYLPIDISGHILNELTASLKVKFPHLEILPLCDDYFHALENLNKSDVTRKIILFLGSNIGNFRGDNAIPFLRHLHADMSEKDKIMIGFDLKKDPNIILNAYNDNKGITRKFNLNLLERINRELGGNFNPVNFKHYATYNPVSGEAKSFLISQIDHEVRIDALKQIFHIAKWEPIFMEISQKYDLSDITRLAVRSGFVVEKNFFDSRKYFTDSLWTLK